MAHRPYSQSSQARKEAIKRRVSEHRRNRKIQAVEYKGGRCRVCDYHRCMAAMTSHHLDPSEKDFGIAHACALSWERVKRELDKCVLLCNRCHTEVHENLVDLSDFLTAEEIEKATRATEETGPDILEFFKFIPR